MSPLKALGENAPCLRLTPGGCQQSLEVPWSVAKSPKTMPSSAHGLLIRTNPVQTHLKLPNYICCKNLISHSQVPDRYEFGLGSWGGVGRHGDTVQPTV